MASSLAKAKGGCTPLPRKSIPGVGILARHSIITARSVTKKITSYHEIYFKWKGHYYLFDNHAKGAFLAWGLSLLSVSDAKSLVDDESEVLT